MQKALNRLCIMLPGVRSDAIGALIAAVDSGLVLSPHRLQPVPHALDVALRGGPNMTAGTSTYRLPQFLDSVSYPVTKVDERYVIAVSIRA